MTRTLEALFSAGGHGPAVAAWLGDGLFQAAAQGEVWSRTAGVDARGGVVLGEGHAREPGLSPDPVRALGRTLLDVFVGRAVRLPADPLLYEVRLAPLLARVWVPDDALRTGALATLLRRMLAFLPSARPDLAECALVWSRLFPADLRARGRTQVIAALAAPLPAPAPPPVAQVRGWTATDDARLAAYRRVAHPNLRRIDGARPRGEVTDLAVEPLPPDEPLEHLLTGPPGTRLRALGVVADVAGAVAALHALGVSHGGVTSRGVRLADDRAVLDGFVLGDRTRLPTPLGDTAFDLREADLWGLGGVLTEVLTGDVRQSDRRPDRLARYTQDPAAPTPPPEIPPTRTAARLAAFARDLSAGGCDAADLVGRLEPEVAQLRGMAVARMREDAGRLGPLVLPDPP